MGKWVTGGLIGLVLVLGACQAEAPPSEPDRKAARRPPEPACAQARADLERRGANGSLLVEESGEAMIERGSWMRMDENGRDRLIGRLAVLAACGADAPQREVEVTIRDENGMVLTSRYVRPSTDFRAD